MVPARPYPFVQIAASCQLRRAVQVSDTQVQEPRIRLDRHREAVGSQHSAVLGCPFQALRKLAAGACHTVLVVALQVGPGIRSLRTEPVRLAGLDMPLLLAALLLLLHFLQHQIRTLVQHIRASSLLELPRAQAAVHHNHLLERTVHLQGWARRHKAAVEMPWRRIISSGGLSSSLALSVDRAGAQRRSQGRRRIEEGREAAPGDSV